MGKTLIIAEKPSVAADIAQALGGFQRSGSVHERADLVISNAVGHLVELHVAEAESGGRGLEALPVIPPTFGLKVIDRAKDQYRVLEAQLRRPDISCVVNACDAGREGELIFRLIIEKAGCMKPMKRMWCQSMTHDALRAAFEGARPGVEYDSLRDAAKSRAEADWLIGINGSRGLTSLRQHQSGRYEGVTAGRVQTPTLAIVVHREREITNFVPRDFWEVLATFGVASGEYTGRWRRQEPPAAAEPGAEAPEDVDATRFYDRDQALALVARCVDQPVDSVSDEVTDVLQAPPRLFDLTTLQREANKRFKFPVKKTLDIAQRLYEQHKMTTYPRTDSSCLPEDYVGEAAKVMNALEDSEWGRFAKQVSDAGWVQPIKRIFDNSKISDHFAIIPTGVQSGRLDADEQRIYDLIVRRFLAAFFPAAEFKKTKRTTVVAGEQFHTTGKVLVSKGWLAVMQDVRDEGEPAAEEASGLCPVAEGETPDNLGVQAKAGKTTPPNRFTEATLLGAMETAGKLVEDEELRAAMSDKGLGTPATRASIIEVLLNDRDGKGNAKEPYLRRDKTYLVPTPKAMSLIDFLEACEIGFLASPQTTGEWEERLNRMARGEYDREAFMAEIRATTQRMIETLRSEASKAPRVEAQVATLQTKCPSCGSDLRAGERVIDCAGCGFKLWREVCGRATTNEEMDRLLAGEVLGGLSGFYSSTKRRNFDAGLRFADGKLHLVFDGPAASAGGGTPGEPGAQRTKPAAPPEKRLACLCPKCEGIIASKPALVECIECGFKVWRESFGKKFSDTDLDKLIYKGELKTVNGLKAKSTGNVYSAGIRLDKETGRMQLVFDGE